jgi:small subunit ribosomal protein S27e
MKKDHIEIPKPASKFHKVNCNECGELQIVYSHAAQFVVCNSCGNNIAEPTGSKARINGKILGSVE